MASYQYVYVMKQLGKIYPGGKQVLKDIWLSFLPGVKIGVIGLNGAGKSTLLKILGGVLDVQSGLRELGHNVKAGYYSQYRVDMLDPTRTVLEEGLDTPQRVTEQFVRTLLGSFLFRGDDVFKKVSVLSGGEKSRLALVKLLLDPPNFLLMDEPLAALDALTRLSLQDELLPVVTHQDRRSLREAREIEKEIGAALHAARVPRAELIVAPGPSGNAVLQFLSSLKSGGENELESGNLANASTILETAIDEISQMRGRLGAFERNVLQTNARSLQTNLENIAASESVIRDADFASETSALTRAQILQNASTSVLATANATSQTVLQLLG